MILKYTFQATFDDGSIALGTVKFEPSTTFTYVSEFKAQPSGFFFPGLTMTDLTPSASAAIEGGDLVMRIGASTLPPLPFGNDYQEFRLRPDLTGQECFIEDRTTVSQCRQIASATVDIDHVQPVPVPPAVGLLGASLLLLVVGLGRRKSI